MTPDIILCFILSGMIFKNTTSALMVIVPGSVFSAREGDDKIEFTTTTVKICRALLLYRS